MQSTYERRLAEQSSIATQLRVGSAKLRRRKFGKVAQLLWPDDTAKVLGKIADTSHRTAERWISGEHDPPPAVIAATILEMCRVQ